MARVIRSLPVGLFAKFVIAQAIIFLAGLPVLAEAPRTAIDQSVGSTKKVSNQRPSNNVEAVVKSKTPQDQETDIVLGRMLYKMNDCAACHSIHGAGCKQGVPLDGIGSRRSRRFLTEQLKDPEEHVAKNQKAFGHDPNLMPQPNLDDREIKFVVKYLMSLQ